MLNRQVVFDAIARHAKKKVRALTEEGQCVYRGLEGSRCFIGVLIPDELFEQGMNGCGLVCHLLGRYRLAPFENQYFSSGAREYLGAGDVFFLGDIQSIHDSNGPKYWDDLLVDFAHRYGLSPAVVLEAANAN